MIQARLLNSGVLGSLGRGGEGRGGPDLKRSLPTVMTASLGRS